MQKKIKKKMFFLGNYISIGCVKMSLIRREYLLSAVSESANSPKILHITKRNFPQLNSLYSDQ